MSTQSDQSTQDLGGNAADFEDTLGKLAELAKGRVKFDEFTQIDRNNLLDLFVNNERTLLKIYEILFSNNANFKQSQILATASDSIHLSDDLSTKNFKMIESSLITQATGHDLSIDQTTDAAAAVFNDRTPNPYDVQNSSSFVMLDDLNENS